MLSHPIFIMLPLIAMLKALKGKSFFFRLVGLVMPVLALIMLLLGEGEHTVEFANLRIIWAFSYVDKIVGSAFLIVLLIANSYSIGQKKYSELVIGSFYGSAALISVLAKDFISMFVGIELMLISASLLIFIGVDEVIEVNGKAAKKYLLTHFVSSNMILIGIVHIISKNNSSEMVLVTDLINNPGYSTTNLYIMFIGFVINIAAFPFSGWMVNYYQKASASGFLYLISFTTKVSIVLLVKLFAGFEYLKYVALLMILYAGYKAVFENNLFSLLSYLSIIAMGVMVLGISFASKSVIFGVICYLFIHIIYKLLLCVLVATLKDCKSVVNCSEIGNVSNRLLSLALLVGVLLITNVPFSLTFYSKLAITQEISNSWFYGLVVIANILTIIALPWKAYLKSNKINSLKLNYYNNLSVFIAMIASLLIGFVGFLIPVFSSLSKVYEISAYSSDILKQLAVFLVAAIVLVKLSYLRKSGKALNLLEVIGNIFFHLYNRFWKKKNPEAQHYERWNVNILETQVLQKLAVFHNQQTAIFIVVVFLLTMFIILL